MNDHAKLEKLRRKSYRDAYLQTHVRGSIANQIRALRSRAKLSQLEFAEKLGKSQSVISRLENTEYGKVTVQTLLDVACALDIALIVRFASYPEFLRKSKEMSEKQLSVETVYESLNRIASSGIESENSYWTQFVQGALKPCDTNLSQILFLSGTENENPVDAHDNLLNPARSSRQEVQFDNAQALAALK